jgi:hypothetical protein
MILQGGVNPFVIPGLRARRTGMTRNLEIPDSCRFTSITSVLRIASGMTDFHAAPSRIGGWNDSAVSQGKKIQVSCDTSVMKVSTSGRPFGLA